VARFSLDRRAVWLALTLILSFIVFVADDVTGSEVSLSLFYLVPVAIASWWVGTWAGVLLSLFSTAGWLGAYALNGRFYSNPRVLPWNLAVEFGVFLALTLTIAAIRHGRERQRALTMELTRAYERLDREFQLIGTIQRSLLPEPVPDIAGYERAVHYAPSARAGGDYYDFFGLSDGRFGVLVADASGHGAAAALVMAMMRESMHSAPDLLDAPERVLTARNARLRGSIPDGQFVTACYLVLDPPTGRMEYSLAGHEPPLLVRAGSRVGEALQSDGGPPLGLFDDARYQRGSVVLEHGDILFLYTDGLIEAQNEAGNFFELPRAQALLIEHCGEPAAAIRDHLVAALERYRGNAAQGDDVTMLLLRRAPLGAV
jgi:serine phosphatase RsbU (regulator of sigma subunit)